MIPAGHFKYTLLCESFSSPFHTNLFFPSKLWGKGIISPGLVGLLPLFLQCVTWSWILSVCMLSCVRLLATPWTVAHQATLSMEFSRQEYCSGLLFPPVWESSQVRNQNCLSYLSYGGRRILKHCATWEAISTSC